jgi:hypothetical protein
VRAGDRSTSTHNLDRRPRPRCAVSKLYPWLILSLVFGGLLRFRSVPATTKAMSYLRSPTSGRKAIDHQAEVITDQSRRCGTPSNYPPWVTAGDPNGDGKLDPGGCRGGISLAMRVLSLSLTARVQMINSLP